MTAEPEKFQEKTTRGVHILTGDPKKAIVELAWPMIIAMVLLSFYQIVDAAWVAGLGPDALAAVGFAGPVFMVLVGMGIGVGAGVTSAVARRIGAGDRAGADNVALHAVLLAVLISAVLTAPLVVFAEPIFLALGAGEVAGLAAEYGEIVFGGAVFVIFSNIAYAILRGEGDTRRTMYAMALSSVLNMILDPLLIYQAGLGVAGAALATVISIATVSALLLYWFFIRRDTYVTLSPANFAYDTGTVADILTVGFPASLEFFLMASVTIILNVILVDVGGTDAVAVYTTGWRVVMFAIIPIIGLGTSVVSVTGAAFGARRFERMELIHGYATKLGVGIGITTSAITWLLAPYIALLFTYSPESAPLAVPLVAFLRTMCFFYPFVPPGAISSSLFQGVGKGFTSLFLNVLRSFIFIAVFAYLLAHVMGFGVEGVWWGIVIGDIAGGLAAFGWAKLYLSRLLAVRGNSPAPA
ncbi:MAG: MATE family efflux transporter [Methanomicrobiaceae archaeon]|nr:MATE family efflux transporter [Methanomicrobiaceae archaeon]